MGAGDRPLATSNMQLVLLFMSTQLHWLHSMLHKCPERRTPSPLSERLLEGEAYKGFIPTLDLLGEGETAFAFVAAPDLALVMAPGGLVSGPLPRPAKTRMLI